MLRIAALAAAAALCAAPAFAQSTSMQTGNGTGMNSPASTSGSGDAGSRTKSVGATKSKKGARSSHAMHGGPSGNTTGNMTSQSH